MASSKAEQPPNYYRPIPPQHQHQHQNYNIILPPAAAAVRRQQRCRTIFAATFLLLAVAVYFLWPSDPDLKIVELHLERINIRTVPVIAVDVTLGLTVKVRNVDIYSIDYSSLVVSIGYRGKKLGYFVTVDHGHVKARGTSYADATLELDGVEVLSDIVMFLRDLARGSVPFDTITEVRGQLEFFLFNIPLKAKVSCEVYVNTRNQTIIHQTCYAEPVMNLEDEQS